MLNVFNFGQFKAMQTTPESLTLSHALKSKCFKFGMLCDSLSKKLSSMFLLPGIISFSSLWRLSNQLNGELF